MNMIFNWKIGGRAGEGIAATSFLMAKIAQRAGLSVFEYGEYPSLIRGGHTTGQVHAGSEPITVQKKMVDLMIVLNEDCIKLHLTEFDEHTKFLVDTQDDKIDFTKYPSIKPEQIVSVPMVQIARETTGKSLASNMVALAVSCSLLGLEKQAHIEVIKSFFGRKGQEVVDENIRAAQKGYEFITHQATPAPEAAPAPEVSTSVEESTQNSTPMTAGSSAEKSMATEPVANTPQSSSNTLLLTGSEAIGFGALSAGVQYYSAYPMTPSSALMTFMADAQQHYPMVLKHAEDEIAAINNVLGAAFSGARAMTGTAGGGFALMVEGVSLAGVTELPLVVLVAGRPGPATGLPTWTSQTDLSYVIYSGHGEFPKVVFTPGNLEECFKLTRIAFLIAEKYQTQVYIIADKILLESRMTIDRSLIPTDFTNQRFSFAQDPLPEDNSYRRFVDTKEGYSPRSVPGQPHGLQLTNSYEHDEFGYATEEAEMTKKMVEKRMRKLDGIIKEIPGPILIGPQEADLTFVCWGSSRLALEEVIKHTNANIIHLMTMLPFKVEEFKNLASKTKKMIMVEENIGRQAEMHIKKETGVTFEHRINRYDGRPLYAEEILEEIQHLH
ncbi:MAG: 2-oxoacid:acceptor oxidoreductase family protein [Candidatus Woesebacteria bacterium]